MLEQLLVKQGIAFHSIMCLCTLNHMEVKKLTPGVNFINILRSAFMHADIKRAKNTVKLLVFFALLESALAKASSKMLVKLTPVLGPQVVHCFDVKLF
jgi:hypothetical protein